jgi:head-tail adaptor
MVIGAGALREKISFQRRVGAADEYGNEQTTWQTVFTTAAQLSPKVGSEPVIAARLTGVQPYKVVIRSNEQSRTMDTSWRIVDARNTSRVFNILTIINADEKNAYLEMLAVQGVAT